MRERVWRFVAAVAVTALFAQRRSLPQSVPTRVPEPNGSECCVAGEQAFVYDAVARFNERLIGNIDAIDTASMAVLAGNVAVLVFTIDKLNELQPHAVVNAVLMLLGVSTLACTVGYIVGFRLRAGDVDGVRPRRFVPDIAHRHDEAIIGAVEQLVSASETNMAVRFTKRVLVVAAIVLLLVAVVLVALARLLVPVVH